MTAVDYAFSGAMLVTFVYLIALMLRDGSGR